MGESSEGLVKSYVMKTSETTLTQYCAGVLDQSAVEDQVVRPDGAAQTDERIAGILQDKTHAADTYGAYQVTGVSYVKLVGTVTLGDDLVVGAATGALVTFDPGSHSSGVDIVGRALRSGVTGDVVPALLCIPNRWHT